MTEQQLPRLTRRGGPRRVYVLWAVALALLLAAGLFSWLVVVPVWRVHNVVKRSEDKPDAAVSELGGPERAAVRLDAYVRSWIAPSDQRYQACCLLARCGKPGVVKLLGLMESRLKENRRQDEVIDPIALDAYGGLTELGPSARFAVPELTKRLRDPLWEIRCAAADALGRIGDRRPVSDLIAALGDWHPMVRRKAAGALGRLGDPKAVPALRELLSDQTWGVNEVAAEAIKKIKQAPSTSSGQAGEGENQVQGAGSRAPDSVNGER